jgi:hypothetical protein
MHKLALPRHGRGADGLRRGPGPRPKRHPGTGQDPSRTPAQRVAGSLDCLRQADAKDLHGKARKHFRSTCMRGMAKGKTPAQNPLGYR